MMIGPDRVHRRLRHSATAPRQLLSAIGRRDMISSLDIPLRPRSVAMIGASGDVTRIGGRAMRHLKEVGFGGDIFPVNPGRDEVQGLRAYRTVEDIPGPVECAVLALATDA